MPLLLCRRWEVLTSRGRAGVERPEPGGEGCASEERYRDCNCCSRNVRASVEVTLPEMGGRWRCMRERDSLRGLVVLLRLQHETRNEIQHSVTRRSLICVQLAFSSEAR